MSERVILLHGLFMRRPVMLSLARRLREEGFETELFGYSAQRHGPDGVLKRLRERMQALGAGTHLVGHSLGGVMALECLKRDPSLRGGRVVCLGSPIAGSAASRGLARARFGFTLGRSRGLLHEGVGELPPGVEVGMIAGSHAFGIGRVFSPLGESHDGTVGMAETRLPGLADHLVIPVNHTALLWSSGTASATARFLREGRFPHRG
ncbi:MAG: alpha/beta hydrolase [Lysobacteraceae bacterium]